MLLKKRPLQQNGCQTLSRIMKATYMSNFVRWMPSCTHHCPAHRCWGRGSPRSGCWGRAGVAWGRGISLWACSGGQPSCSAAPARTGGRLAGRFRQTWALTRGGCEAAGRTLFRPHHRGHRGRPLLAPVALNSVPVLSKTDKIRVNLIYIHQQHKVKHVK